MLLSLKTTMAIGGSIVSNDCVKAHHLYYNLHYTAEVLRLTSILLSKLTELAKSKRGLSKFYTMALRLVGIKVDDDMLPDMMMWREVETAAAESEHSAGLRV